MPTIQSGSVQRVSALGQPKQPLNALKVRAKRLRTAIAHASPQGLNLAISHAQALELVAREEGYPNWDAASASTISPQPEGVTRDGWLPSRQFALRVIGQAGWGKSTLVGGLLHAYAASGKSIVVLDIGQSYLGLCRAIGGTYHFAKIAEPAHDAPSGERTQRFGVAPLVCLDMERLPHLPSPNKPAMQTNAQPGDAACAELERVGCELNALAPSVESEWLSPKGVLVVDEVFAVSRRVDVEILIDAALTSGGSVIVVAQHDDDVPQDWLQRHRGQATRVHNQTIRLGA